jgi:hypothetical protein
MIYNQNCTNLPEPYLDPPEDTRRVVYVCALCEEPVYEGDDYYKITGLGVCCTNCIDDAHHYDAE